MNQTFTRVHNFYLVALPKSVAATCVPRFWLSSPVTINCSSDYAFFQALPLNFLYPYSCLSLSMSYPAMCNSPLSPLIRGSAT